MGRSKKLTLDFFIHDVHASDDIKIQLLEARFKLEGYATFFKLLELLGRHEGVQLPLTDHKLVRLLALKFHLRDEVHLLAIIQECVELELFDRQMWESERIVFSHDLLENNRSQFNRKIREAQVHEYIRHREYVYSRDGYQCIYCGARENLSLDHIIPLTRGGGNEPGNLATACGSCNSSKGNKTPEEWRQQS